jgi:hypothetical protein
LDVVSGLFQGMTPERFTRLAAGLVDRTLAQAVYSDYVCLQPSHCAYWLDEHSPATPAGDVVHVHGDRIEVGTGIAVARGASVQTAIAQDNRHGGTGSIDFADNKVGQVLT